MPTLMRKAGQLWRLTSRYDRGAFSSLYRPELLQTGRSGSTITRYYCQKEGSTPPTGIPSDEDGPLPMPSIFPDPRDPNQHPLASLSTEEMKGIKEYWNKAQSSEQAPVYKQKLLPDGRAFAIGGRKRSKAKVWIGDGSGKLVINGRPWVDYFPRIDHRDKILRPFAILDLIGKIDVECTVRGGGPTGQAEALRHGISRALQNWDPAYRPALKSEGLLTRDSRVVESKKYGRKKARKSFQWVKR